MRILLLALVSLAFGVIALLAVEAKIVDGGKVIRLLPKDAHVVYHLSQKEAKIQIREIIKTATMEDMWLCVEGQGLVYDVGHSGTEDSTKGDFCVMKKHPEIFRNALLVHTHIHPVSSGDEERNTLSMPSLADLEFAQKHSAEFHSVYNATTTFEVLDGHGIWRYGTGRRFGEFANEGSSLGREFDATGDKYHCDRCGSVSRGMSREKKIRLYLAEVHALGIDMTYEDLP